MDCKHLVGIKCTFKTVTRNWKNGKLLASFDRGQWQFPNLFSFKVLFPEVKSLSGMVQLHKLMRNSDLHIVAFSFHHLSHWPCSQWWGPTHPPPLLKPFWALPHSCMGLSSSIMAIFFNHSTAPWHYQTLLQYVWSHWWFWIWFLFLVCFFKKLWIILSWNTPSSHLLVKPIVIVPFSLPQMCWSSFFPSIYFCLLSIAWNCSYKNHLLPLLHLIKLQGPINGIKQTPWGMITSLDDSQTPFFLFLFSLCGSSTLAKNSCSALCTSTESSHSQCMIFGATTDFASPDLALDRSQPISWIRILGAEQRPVSINHHGKLIPNILLPHMISAVIKLSYVTYAGAQAGA